MGKEKMENIVEIKELSYTYPDGTEALKNVNLNVKRGERLAVMGANGSGKSTLFLHLNGIIKAQTGEIKIDGEVVSGSKKNLIEIRKKVGIVFQEPDNQLFASSVRQEISFGPLNLGLSEEEVKRRVDETIETLGLKDIERKPTHFLSGGQKKRVAIGDVLVMQPKIIIFDEPAAGLDPKHIKIVDEIIEKLSKSGITVIMATHDVNRALKWADRVVLFGDGKIIDEGKPQDIFRRDELLADTNLEKPPILALFERLICYGAVANDEKPPKTLEELDLYIRKVIKK